MELVSVHLPKAGGTSLLEVLRKHYGAGLLEDYDHREPASRRERLVRTFPWTAQLLPGVRCIHGHFPASRYPGRLAIFIRHPLERRISAWRFFQRNFANVPEAMQRNWKDRIIPLEDYLEQEDTVFTRLVDVPVRRFAFVGRMNCYEGDFARFCRAILGCSYELPHARQAPDDFPDRFDLLDLYKRRNSAQLELYEELKQAAEAMHMQE